MDVGYHTVEIRFGLTRWSAGHRVRQTTEVHRCRFFFPGELGCFLKAAGLDLVKVSAFPDLDKAADETSWNAAIVGRAV